MNLNWRSNRPEHESPRADSAAEVMRKAGAAKAARDEAMHVVERWNRAPAAGRDALWSLTIRCAITAGMRCAAPLSVLWHARRTRRQHRLQCPVPRLIERPSRGCVPCEQHVGRPNHGDRKGAGIEKPRRRGALACWKAARRCARV